MNLPDSLHTRMLCLKFGWPCGSEKDVHVNSLQTDERTHKTRARTTQNKSVHSSVYCNCFDFFIHNREKPSIHGIADFSKFTYHDGKQGVLVNS